MNQIIVVFSILALSVYGQEHHGYFDSVCTARDIVVLGDKIDLITNIDKIDSSTIMEQVSIKEIIPKELDINPSDLTALGSAVSPTATLNWFYVLFLDVSDSKTYLSIVIDNKFDGPDEIHIIGKLNEPKDAILSGITFDCAGNLFAIDTKARIWEIDTGTPSIHLVDNHDKDRCYNEDRSACLEIMTYDWQNNVFNRISSSNQAGDQLLFVRLSDGIEIEIEIRDPDNLCHESVITAFEYWGNGLFGISCYSENTTNPVIRWLDTSQPGDAVIVPFTKTTEIVEITDSGYIAGLVPFIDSFPMLCVPQSNGECVAGFHEAVLLKSTIIKDNDDEFDDDIFKDIDNANPDHYGYDVELSMDMEELINLWVILFVFLFVNMTICWCYYRKKSTKISYSDDSSLPPQL